MRKPFERQMTIGMIPMSKISFDIYCRHELVPILMALQHLYSCEAGVLDRILDLIKNDVIGNSNDNLGCSGMDYWDILVLAAVRLGCNLDYDALHDLANNHITLRDIMRIDRLDDKRFPRATIHDNLSKLTAETILKISDVIVDLGHKLSPKAIERVRGDSFVVQKNIHYPTDANLIFDGVRKSIELSVRSANAYSIDGWRKHASLLKNIKKVLRSIQKIARSKQKNKEEKFKGLYEELIERVHKITGKCLDTIATVASIRMRSDASFSLMQDPTISEIFYYLIATQNMCELAERRVFEGEKIPHSEKIFSLFEPYTELINRGKVPYPIEFGHRVFIIQDSAGFIVHSRVMGIGVTDEKVLVDAMKKLQGRFNDRIRAASFDKGFWTPNNLKELSGIIPLVCLPKKGKRSKADQEREGSKEFAKIRKWHPGIESAINALGTGNGLIVCRDKDEDGYERYVALGILGRNLQTLGTIFLNKERMRRRSRKKVA